MTLFSGSFVISQPIVCMPVGLESWIFSTFTGESWTAIGPTGSSGWFSTSFVTMTEAKRQPRSLSGLERLWNQLAIYWSDITNNYDCHGVIGTLAAAVIIYDRLITYYLAIVKLAVGNNEFTVNPQNLVFLSFSLCYWLGVDSFFDIWYVDPSGNRWCWRAYLLLSAHRKSGHPWNAWDLRS